jgi:signal peptide peptidase-like protein 2B
MFLSAVRLPNLQVATILLSLACFYDMFFVFISPYVFNSSVMITVAEGPTSSFETNDENYCEKYPDDEYCSSNTLPMLITVPSISSYVSSESMLGLGDIVLPGLLVVFCARLDMRNRGTLSNLDAVKEYFPMVIIAYAIGLLMANLAVEYFEYGQPALIYIVPLTLGSVLQRAYSNGTLPLLWVRLPSMKTVAVPVDVEEQVTLKHHIAFTSAY